MKLSGKNDLSWKEIAERIPGRTSKMCYSRYRRIESRSKEQWTKTEDSKILGLIENHGFDWEKISEFMPSNF